MGERLMAYLDMSGLGQAQSAPWGSFNYRQYGSACAPQDRPTYQQDAGRVISAFRDADAVISKAQLTLQSARPAYERLVKDPALEERVYEVQGYMPELEDAGRKVEQARGELANVWRDFSGLIQKRFAGGVCVFVDAPGNPVNAPEYLARVSAAANKAAGAVKNVPGRIRELTGIVSKIKREKQEQARQAALQQRQIEEQAAAEAEARRIEAEVAAKAEAEARAAELEAEREARRFELQLKQQELEAQTAREEAERQRLAEQERLRREAEERKVQLELEREQRAFEAEQRRLALEEERRLREEERQLRAQEREEELKRLMLLQELASAGLPAAFAPPGATAVPAVPAAAFPGIPGAPAAPAFVPPGAVAPTVPPAFPQQAPAPATPPAPPPAAAGPVPYQQSAPLTAPQAAAPPGFQWAAFDPGAEMFGLGAPVPAGNPTLVGAQIEEGYVVVGPENGQYQIIRPDQSVIYKTEDEMYSAIYDRGRLIYYPPQQRPPSAAPQIAASIAQVLAAGAGAAGQVFSERERRKAVEAQVKAGYQPPVYAPPPGYDRRRNGSGVGTVLVLGALGAGVVILAVASKKKSKKSA